MSSRMDRPTVPLADAMLHEVIAPESEVERKLRRWIARNEVHKVIADEVAAYAAEHFTTTGELWEAIPSLAPPFREMWVEMAYKPLGKSSFRWGAALQYWEREEDGDLPEIDAQLLSTYPEWRWRVEIAMISDRITHLDHFCEFTLLLDYDGKVMQDHKENKASLMWHPYMGTGNSESDITALMPLMLAVGFMHCTNLVYDPVRISPRVEREYRRTHGRELLTYKTIRIVPFRPTRVPVASTTGEERPWHKVRGHFADYRRTGLFGKHFGIYWIPEHGRGNPKIGTVEHTYEVKQPEEVISTARQN